MPTLNVAIDARGAKVGAREFSRSADRMQKSTVRADSAVRKMSGGLGRLAGALKSAALITAPLIGALVGVRTAAKALQLASQFETTRIGFETLTGSVEQANKTLQELEDFAATTPFQFQDLADTTKRMLAFGFSIEEVIPTMRTLGDATAAMGGSSELMNRVVVALGQMRAKGKVSGEEMRQLAEAGIPVWDMLAERIGVGVPEAMKLVEKGAVDVQSAIQGLLAGMDQRFGGATQKIAESTGGLFSTLKDNVSFLLRDVGTALIEGLDIRYWLSNATRNVQQWKDSIVGAVASIAHFVKENLIPVFGAFRGVISGTAELLMGAFRTSINFLSGLLGTSSGNFELWRDNTVNVILTLEFAIRNLADVTMLAGLEIRGALAEIPKQVGDAIASIRNLVPSVQGVIGAVVGGATAPSRIIGGEGVALSGLGATVLKAVLGVSGVASENEAQRKRKEQLRDSLSSGLQEFLRERRTGLGLDGGGGGGDVAPAPAALPAVQEASAPSIKITGAGAKGPGLDLGPGTSVGVGGRFTGQSAAFSGRMQQLLAMSSQTANNTRRTAENTEDTVRSVDELKGAIETSKGNQGRSTVDIGF